MKKKVFSMSGIFLAMIAVLFSVSAQTTTLPAKSTAAGAKASDKAAAQPVFDPDAFRASVNEATGSVVKITDEKAKTKGIEMLSYSKTFKIISEEPRVEKIMHINRQWYLNISKMLAEMSKHKTEMEVTEERNLADRLNAAKKSYAVLLPKFKYLMEHPVKLEQQKGR